MNMAIGWQERLQFHVSSPETQVLRVKKGTIVS